MDEKVTIERNGKRVEGAVKEIDNHVVRWSRKAFASTSYFYAEAGWREVSKAKWVPAEVKVVERCLLLDEKSALSPYVNLPKGYRWKTVEIEREEAG